MGERDVPATPAAVVHVEQKLPVLLERARFRLWRHVLKTKTCVHCGATRGQVRKNVVFSGRRKRNVVAVTLEILGLTSPCTSTIVGPAAALARWTGRPQVVIEADLCVDCATAIETAQRRTVWLYAALASMPVLLGWASFIASIMGAPGVVFGSLWLGSMVSIVASQVGQRRLLQGVSEDDLRVEEAAELSAPASWQRVLAAEFPEAMELPSVDTETRVRMQKHAKVDQAARDDAARHPDMKRT